jgi:hypothetical protein
MEVSIKNNLLNVRDIPDCCGACIHFSGTADIQDRGYTICKETYCDVVAFSRPCDEFRRVFEYSRFIDYCTEEVREKLGITGCEEKCSYGTHIFGGGKKKRIQACRKVIEKSSRGDLEVHLIRQLIKKLEGDIYGLLSVEPHGAVDNECDKIRERIKELKEEISYYE